MRLPAIATSAVWEKVSKGRAGTMWDNVVDEWKEIGGHQEEYGPWRSLGSIRQK